MTGRVGFPLLACAAIALVAASVGAQAESHARIVRLSFVDGQVQMAHADQGLDRAILNTPIVEGTRIVTKTDGLAEVEFEDSSALRLAENSEVKFRRLAITDAGAKVDEIEVVRGVVFFDVRAKSEDAYHAIAGSSTFLVRRNTLARISAPPEQVQLAVLRGDVQLENQPQLVSVKKNETLTLDPNQPSDYKVTHGTEPLPVDAWNKEREAYTNAYASNQGYGGPRSGYGLQDLNYYGDYFYAPGYGYAWQPYGFANSMIGWSPYSNGAWAFVPGFGYSWASAYPWGWLPFHYGSWAFLGGGVGWAWLPGSYPTQWYANNFQTMPVITKPPAGYQPVSAPAAPSGGASAPTILVGKAAGQPAYIPGGRIPPNFSSVISGRAPGALAATNGLVSPNARNELSVNHYGIGPNSSRGANSGHVFAAPQSAYGVSGFGSIGSGARSGGYSASSAGRAGFGASSAGHSGGSGGGGGHSGSGH
jgi:FecR protein